MMHIIPKYMQMKRRILENIVEAPVDDNRFRLSQLNIADSGLGLSDSELTSHAAFVASASECMFGFIDQHNITEQDQELPYSVDYLLSLAVLQSYDNSITQESLLEKIENGLADKLQHQLSQSFLHRNDLKSCSFFPILAHKSY